MNAELERVENFEVKEHSPVEDLTSYAISNAMDVTWLIDGKSLYEVDDVFEGSRKRSWTYMTHTHRPLLPVFYT